MGALVGGIGNIVLGAKGAADDQAAAQQEWQANDALARYHARAARLKGEQQAGEIRSAGSELAARQRTAYAASGVDATVGTAAAVQADTAAQSELDAQTAKNNAAREAWGFKVQQEQAKRTYNAKVTAAQNRAIGSVLTGAGQIMGASSGLGGL